MKPIDQARSPSFQTLINFVKEDKKAYLVGIVLSVITGLLEFVGVTSLVPLLSGLSGEAVTGLPDSLQKFFFLFSPLQLAAVFGGLILLQAGLGFWRESYFITRVAWLRTKLSLDYIRKIIYSQWSELGKLQPGEVEVMLTRDMATAMKIRCLTANFIADLILSVMYIGIIVFLSWITLVLLFFVSVIFFLIHKLTLKWKVFFAWRARERFIIIARKVIEYFADPRTLIISNRQSFLGLLGRQFDDAAKVLAQTDRLTVFLRHIHQPILLFSFFIAAAILFLLGHKLSLLAAIFYIFLRAAPRLVNVIRGYGEILGDSVIDVVPEIRRFEKLQARSGGKTPESASLVLAGVDVSYDGNKPLLHNLTFTVQEKEFVCLIGRSGVGKSTILDIICGLRAPDHGIVKLGGVEYEVVNWQLWREQIGLLRAEGVVVSGSWIENVAFLVDKPNLAKVAEMLQLVGLNQLVNESEEGIASQITARGANLSAGQRQRLLLARALYREPKLLLLDEPTSNLDAKTEADICSLLARLKGFLTIIVVSHREPILALADQVYQVATDGTLSIVSTNVMIRGLETS